LNLIQTAVKVSIGGKAAFAERSLACQQLFWIKGTMVINSYFLTVYLQLPGIFLQCNRNMRPLV